ncbi:hypothetical protein OROGR_010061 [Orobanche gracilis]
MEFWPKSLNRLCKSSSLHFSSKMWTSRRVIAKTRLIHTPSISGNSEMHNKLKFLIARRHNGSVYYSTFSTGQNPLNGDVLYFPNTMRSCYFFPSASCNALLFAYFPDHRLSAALWNPTTDELKSLPKSSVPRPPLTKEAYVTSFGFGFDRASEDYKVIRFITLDYDFRIQVELYSLKSDSWKEITYPRLPAFSTAPYTIPLPETNKLGDLPSNCLLAEFDGSLAAFVYSDPLDGKKHFDFEIWVWKDESSWARVASEIIIDQRPAAAAAVRKPLCFLNSDKFYFQDTNGQLLLFDCSKRELKNLGLNADASMVSVLPYVQSVEPIKA